MLVNPEAVEDDIESDTSYAENISDNTGLNVEISEDCRIQTVQSFKTGEK